MQVENQLFKVHRYFFIRESHVFRDILPAAHPENARLEQPLEYKPIKLDVASLDFERLLWVFYNPCVSPSVRYWTFHWLWLSTQHRNFGQYEATVDEWSSILRLAHLWKFQDIKELAIRYLDKMTIEPVHQAALAQTCDVELNWKLNSYNAIGIREEPLTEEEGLRLGLTTTTRLVRARERIRDHWKAEAERKAEEARKAAEEEKKRQAAEAERQRLLSMSAAASYNNYFYGGGRRRRRR